MTANSVAAVKKALKTAKVTVWVQRSALASCLSGYIHIKVPSTWKDEPGTWVDYICVQGQANDYLVKDDLVTPRDTDNAILGLKKVSDFYACHTHAKMSFGYTSYGYEDPVRNANFIKIIKDRIKKLELRSECQFSQILTALADLGAKVDLENIVVCEKPAYMWNAGRG